jgi:aspartokinase-like uncharacterized kinase
MGVEQLPLSVVKVGGSLFDLPELACGLRSWLAQRSNRRNLLVPGGGPLADAIRSYHEIHQLSEEQSHWLAIRTMQINANLLAGLLNGCKIVNHPAQMPSAGNAILDAFAFCMEDEHSDGALPHSWQVTSDSIAARVAKVGNAESLVLLKSIELAPPFDWKALAQAGLVDYAFDSAIGAGSFSVEWVNFRK